MAFWPNTGKTMFFFSTNITASILLTNLFLLLLRRKLLLRLLAVPVLSTKKKRRRRRGAHEHWGSAGRLCFLLKAMVLLWARKTMLELLGQDESRAECVNALALRWQSESRTCTRERLSGSFARLGTFSKNQIVYAALLLLMPVALATIRPAIGYPSLMASPKNMGCAYEEKFPCEVNDSHFSKYYWYLPGSVNEQTMDAL